VKQFLTLIAICILSRQLNAQVSFSLSSSPAVGAGPQSVTAVDVNADGKVDLTSANANANTLSVLTNNGSGGFVTSSNYPVGSFPGCVVASDVNGDGAVDLISANSNDNTLSVLTNNGNGGFTISGIYSVGAEPEMVAAVDVNGDGKVDLISADQNANALMVLTNNGSGGFVVSGNYGVGLAPRGLTTAEVNGDGKVDLISENYYGNSLSVLTNDGKGGFVTSGNYSVGLNPLAVAAADFNGDGKMDLVSANLGDNTLSVLTNDGTGNFILASTPGVGIAPAGVVVADVNGDGVVDLISANNGSSDLSVLTNNGSGGFVLDNSLSVGSNPYSVTATDVNGDGKLDLVSANTGANTLSVLTNASPYLPRINNQPQSQRIIQGMPASLTVTATGFHPLSYQWLFYGTNIPGATNSSLVFTNIQLTNAGFYTVVVSNSFGVVTSSNTVLQVLPNGAPSIQVNGQFAVGMVTSIGPASVTLSNGYPSGGIFYTLDGSAPTTNSTPYAGPFTLTNSAVVQALGVSTDFSQSSEAPVVGVQVIPLYTLQSATIGGGLLRAVPASVLYPSNSTVTLTAYALPYSLFDHWTGDASGNQNPLSVTMNGPRSVQAVFVPTAYPLTVSTPVGGNVTANGQSISGPTFYTVDSMVTLSATASNGWYFAGWQGDASGTNNPLILTMSQTNNIQAIFGLSAQAPDWPSLSFSQKATNIFNHPDVITHTGDNSGRMFVVEQGGRTWIIQSNNVLPQPFLDISGRVLSAGAEQGLLGLVFPPGYSTNGHFYVDYTRKPDGAVVISRFLLTSTNSNVADTTSEQMILVINKPYNNHNAGQLAFGPDGYLYIGVGDGGSEGDPQNIGQKTSTLLGKLLRIDVESGISPYNIPISNPFVGITNYSPEIWALGLRNPWRFSFDRLTGDFYIGDVGQNLYEEIDFRPAGSPGGQNYGWRIMEGYANYSVPLGFTNFAAFTLPATVYSHSSLPSGPYGSGAVIGGYVYRGPSQLRMNGMYFYGDFSVGWIWGLKQIGTNWQSLPLLNPPYSSSSFQISTFGEDDQGDLFVADYYRGKIYQIQDSLQVWTPKFSPSNGTINNNLVTVTCPTPSAVVHYTGDGLDPTESDPVVASGGVIQVSSGTTNKLRAFRPDLSPSAVASAIFTFQVGTPKFSPPQGPITNNTPVQISTVTPGAAIFYTTNGTVPTTNSFIYSNPLVLSGGTTLKALGVIVGYGNSTVAIASYSFAQAATPTFSPSSGPITNGTSISIACATPGAVIYYTLDGSTPTTNSAIYTAPVTINGGTTLDAMAVAGGYLTSAVQSTFYQLVPTATPVFSPSSGPVAYGTGISISCATPGATIYFTTDGTTPSTNSAIYSVPPTIYNDFTLSAFAIAPDHLNSAIQSASFTLLQAAAPIFSQAAGALTNGTLISISSATSNVVIRYTLDGSDPDTNVNALIYLSPVIFTNPVTLTARAYRSDMDTSTATSASYVLVDFENNVVVTTLAGGSTAGFSNAPGILATFSNPQGVCIDRLGNLYVADTGNNVIRKISASGLVTTFAGTGTNGSQLGAATNAQFSGPTGVIIDGAGNVYVADSGNQNRICKIDTNGIVTVLAYVASPGSGSSLWQLVTGPDNNLYTGWWFSMWRITTSGTVTQMAGPACNCAGGWGSIVGPGVDSQTNIYSATSVYVWKTSSSGTTELFAGNGMGFSDGPRLLSGFYLAQDAAVDSATNIFVTDLTRIRKIRPDGWVSTVAGNGISGYVNGRGPVAEFKNAAGLCVDSQGNIYVADSWNNCIRKISVITAPPSLQITTSTNQVILTWPIWANDFTLETATTLTESTVWTPLTNGVTTLVNNFVLTNNVGTASSFYRLYRP
jgi:glucose/arabinose dehydrogenase